MVLKYLTGAAAIAMSSSVFSAATLQVPEDIKIVAVNNQEIAAGLLKINDKYKLDDGINILSVRYQGYFQHPDNSHDILKSGVVALQTPALKDGAVYRLALIDAPKDFDQASRYKDQPIIGLYDQDNQLLVRQSGAQKARSWLTYAFSDSSMNNAANTNNTVLNPSVSLHAGKAAAAGAPAVYAGEKQQLIQNWKQASKTERQNFLNWLAEQANTSE